MVCCMCQYARECPFVVQNPLVAPPSSADCAGIVNLVRVHANAANSLSVELETSVVFEPIFSGLKL